LVKSLDFSSSWKQFLRPFRTHEDRFAKMENTDLQKAFQFFLQEKERLLEDHEGKFVVIKGETILGVYGEEMEAIDKTSKDHELGTFIVQQCLRGDEADSATFHSAVII